MLEVQQVEQSRTEVKEANISIFSEAQAYLIWCTRGAIYNTEYSVGRFATTDYASAAARQIKIDCCS